jgi:hypothetical protein
MMLMMKFNVAITASMQHSNPGQRRLVPEHKKAASKSQIRA